MSIEKKDIFKVIKKFNIGEVVYYISHEEVIETEIKSFKRITSTGKSL